MCVPIQVVVVVAEGVEVMMNKEEQEAKYVFLTTSRISELSP